MTLVHADDCERHRLEAGDVRAWRRDLGAAARSVGVGLKRIEVDPGCRSSGFHVHGAEEEIFFVLAGSGTLVQGEAAYRVGAGDAIAHPPKGEPHVLAAGEGGLDVLAFGDRVAGDATWLPFARAMWLGARWVPPDGPNPIELEAAAGPFVLPPTAPRRPPNLVALEDVVPDERRRGDTGAVRRDLGRAAGSVRTGLRHVSVDAGALSAPPHCHSAEEELFVVLEGDGSLLLGGEEHPVREGHVAARPPGTGVAHAFRAGPGGLTLLAYGTRRPEDVAFYPRSGKAYLRGVGLVTRLDPLDYWDGEE